MDKIQVKIAANNVYVTSRGLVYLGDMVCPVNQILWKVKIRDEWYSLAQVVHKAFPNFQLNKFSPTTYEFAVSKWYSDQLKDLNLNASNELEELQKKVEKQKEKILEGYKFEVGVIDEIYAEY